MSCTPKILTTWLRGVNEYRFFQIAAEDKIKQISGMLFMQINPCLECGACCAYYRASFYWAESDLAQPGGVPSELTEKLDDFRLFMKGSNGSNPRCLALMGIIGKKVHCSIYERRASVCRDFPPSWENGVHNERCDQARISWGLTPLSPEIWYLPENFPRAA